MIQKTRHLDSIVARALIVADFIDSIGQSEKSVFHPGLSAPGMGSAIPAERSQSPRSVRLQAVEPSLESRKIEVRKSLNLRACWIAGARNRFDLQLRDLLKTAIVREEAASRIPTSVPRA